jgi:magnesium transporter
MERQLTMDVDMAMQLSLARRDTLATAPGPSPPQSSPFPPNEDNGHIFPEPDHNDALFEDTAIPQPPLQRSEPLLLTPHNTDDPQASNFGLPTYQANVSQSAFDFGMMEEFAATEKTRLGLSSSPTTRFSLPPLRDRPKPDILPQTDPELYALASGSGQPGQNGDGQPGEPTAEVAEDTSNRPLRHRKLSQSNSAPRTHRKGIGGKMAMFESNPNENPSSFSARLGLALNTSGVGLTGGGNSYEHISGVPGVSPAGGILLNTGHDRPYRFSFYSNALSATIHARSLSELPAEGQTFEQLFTGLQPTDASPSDPNKRSSTTTSPPYQEAVGGRAAFPGNHGTDYGNNPHGNPTSSNPSNNFRRSINGQSDKVGPNGGGGPGPDVQDANTWWLDVQNPTDEEMKMLSKVHAFILNPFYFRDPHPASRCSDPSIDDRGYPDGRNERED